MDIERGEGAVGPGSVSAVVKMGDIGMCGGWQHADKYGQGVLQYA
jgi:hypothetical protein